MENLNVNFSGLGKAGGILAVLFIIAMVFLRILFTVCLWNDASRLRDRGRSTVMLTPFTWDLAALVCGLVAVALYWLCHYSRFVKKEP